MSRQYFVKNYPNKKQSQVSFLLLQVVFIKDHFFIEPEIWQLIAILFAYIFCTTETIWMYTKCKKIGGNKSSQFSLMNHLIINKL